MRPLDIITEQSLTNAFVLDMAMGGSTNTILHTLALAYSAGIPFNLARLNEISARTPNICKVSPSRPEVHIEDVHRAGGIPAILKELDRAGTTGLEARRADRDRTTGRCRASRAPDADGNVIRTVEKAFSQTGGLVVLFGNLAPKGAVVKVAGVVAGHDGVRGPGADLRVAGRRAAGHSGRRSERRRRGGDPLRRAARRSGNAGDALAHGGAGRRGSARCSDHRWPLLGRHARTLHRPRLAGGRGGRPDCRGTRRRPDLHQRQDLPAGVEGERRGDRAAARRSCRSSSRR